MLFELAVEPAFASPVAAYMGISKFPAVRRDIAVIVGQDVPVAKLERSVRAAAGATLRNVVVFDVYVGGNIETGSKSVALGLILQETSRTLTDEDADTAMAAAIAVLEKKFAAYLRD